MVSLNLPVFQPLSFRVLVNLLEGTMWEPFTSGIHAESLPKMIRFKLKLILASWSGESRRGCVRKIRSCNWCISMSILPRATDWHKGSFAIFRQTIINYLRVSSFPPLTCHFGIFWWGFQKMVAPPNHPSHSTILVLIKLRLRMT